MSAPQPNAATRGPWGSRVSVGRAEAEWVRGLLRELASGSLPGLAVWRAFHEGGEIPAEKAV